jgi:hypothetical protein
VPNSNMTNADLNRMLSHIEKITNMMMIVSEELKNIYLAIFSNYLTRKE